MSKKFVLVISLFVLLSCLLQMRFNPVEVKAPNGYPVHNLNTGLNYTTIQAAINAPETLDGHTIFVEEGIYYEWIDVEKSLSLVGEERETTTIDGLGIEGPLVRVTANNVNISRFTVRNSDTSIEPSPGIYLNHVFGCNISNNIVENTSCAIFLGGWSPNNLVSNNIVRNNNRGIELSTDSSRNILSENVMANNEEFGISIMDNDNNILIGNNISDCGFGIYMMDSFNNSLSGNRMIHNEFDLYVHATFDVRIESFVHNIDASNLIDEKPVYYLINQRNIVINSSFSTEIGYLALINSTDITVKKVSSSGNGQGLLLAYTNNSSIIDSAFTCNNGGIELYGSCNNSVVGNRIEQNSFGIYIINSSENSIFNNRISDNFAAFRIRESTENIFCENTIIDNKHGVYMDNLLKNNIFYHNNFINNTQHIKPYEDGNAWDNGYEGNYWSDYSGTDSNCDGICDIPYVIAKYNLDRYPLMGMFHSFNTSLGKHVNVISNSTIENFEYFESSSMIRMYVSGEPAYGFCRACIPHELMNVTSISVIINDGATTTLHSNYTLYDNGTHRWIYFAYEHSILEIIIIPEFLSMMILPLFMIATLLAVILYRRKHSTQV